MQQERTIIKRLGKHASPEEDTANNCVIHYL